MTRSNWGLVGMATFKHLPYAAMRPRHGMTVAAGVAGPGGQSVSRRWVWRAVMPAWVQDRTGPA